MFNTNQPSTGSRKRNAKTAGFAHTGSSSKERRRAELPKVAQQPKQVALGDPALFRAIESLKRQLRFCLLSPDDFRVSLNTTTITLVNKLKQTQLVPSLYAIYGYATLFASLASVAYRNFFEINTFKLACNLLFEIRDKFDEGDDTLVRMLDSYFIDNKVEGVTFANTYQAIIENWNKFYLQNPKVKHEYCLFLFVIATINDLPKFTKKKRHDINFLTAYYMIKRSLFDPQIGPQLKKGCLKARNKFLCLTREALLHTLKREIPEGTNALSRDLSLGAIYSILQKPDKNTESLHTKFQQLLQEFRGATPYHIEKIRSSSKDNFYINMAYDVICHERPELFLHYQRIKEVLWFKKIHGKTLKELEQLWLKIEELATYPQAYYVEIAFTKKCYKKLQESKKNPMQAAAQAPAAKASVDAQKAQIIAEIMQELKETDDSTDQYDISARTTEDAVMNAVAEAAKTILNYEAINAQPDDATPQAVDTAKNDDVPGAAGETTKATETVEATDDQPEDTATQAVDTAKKDDVPGAAGETTKATETVEATDDQPEDTATQGVDTAKNDDVPGVAGETTKATETVEATDDQPEDTATQDVDTLKNDDVPGAAAETTKATETFEAIGYQPNDTSHRLEDPLKDDVITIPTKSPSSSGGNSSDAASIPETSYYYYYDDENPDSDDDERLLTLSLKRKFKLRRSQQSQDRSYLFEMTPYQVLSDADKAQFSVYKPHLQIKPSQIPNAGNGLWIVNETKKILEIPRNTPITFFDGHYQFSTDVSGIKRSDQGEHLFHAIPASTTAAGNAQWLIVGSSDFSGVEGYGHAINHSELKEYRNVTIDRSKLAKNKLMSVRLVVTTKALTIEPNKALELFTKYTDSTLEYMNIIDRHPKSAALFKKSSANPKSGRASTSPQPGAGHS